MGRLNDIWEAHVAKMTQVTGKIEVTDAHRNAENPYPALSEFLSRRVEKVPPAERLSRVIEKWNAQVSTNLAKLEFSTDDGGKWENAFTPEEISKLKIENFAPKLQKIETAACQVKALEYELS